jgi:amidase
MPIQEICFFSAEELVKRILSKDLSAVEVMEAHLAQIDRINPIVNAIVTLLPEQAMSQAKAVDEAMATGKKPGALHGLPIAHKDLVLTRGIRTTLGSPIFKDFVPQEACHKKTHSLFNV